MKQYPRIFDVEINPRNSSGVVVPFSYSSHAHDGLEPRVTDPGTIPIAMFSGSSLSGSLEIGSVNIVLKNEDGGLDFLRTYAFDGCSVLVSAADQRLSDAVEFESSPDFFDGFTEISPIGSTDTEETCILTGEQVQFDEFTVTILCRDYRHKLDKPLLIEKYAGTNTGAPLAGVEGTADDLKGHGKPFLTGTALNISPFLVNTSKLIYQVCGVYPFTIPFDFDFFSLAHTGGLRPGFTITVYDKRSPLTRGADYASQAAMEATAPTAGQYRVWPAGGCFRLAVTPAGRVTADVTNPPYTGATNSLQSVCHRIVRIADSDRHENSIFEALWTANPQAGIYINDDTSVLGALEQALMSVGAFITNETVTWQGTASVQAPPFFFQLNAPESMPQPTGAITTEIDRNCIIPGSLRQLVAPGPARGLPVWRVNVNYKRNYTVMSESDLAGVAVADIEFCKQEWRTVFATSATVRTQWPDAIEMTVDSLLIDTTEAQAEADRLLALFGTRREMYQVKVYGWAIRHLKSVYFSGDLSVASLLRITYPRFGMDAGRTFSIVAIDMNLQTDEYDLTFWG